MTFRLPFRYLSFVLLPAAMLSSCSLIKPAEPTKPLKPKRVMYEWYDDQGPGEVKIRIDLDSQRAYYTRGNRPIGWSYVATGKPGHSTPVGTFRITEKVVDKHSNRYGWIEDDFGNVVNGDAKPSTRVPKGCSYVPAPMPYWMRLTDYGIGMHAGLIPEPGQPASHGCIRLPKPLAPLVHDAVKEGTKVVIQR